MTFGCWQADDACQMYKLKLHVLILLFQNYLFKIVLVVSVECHNISDDLKI
jgi:hypothetical protein